MRWILWSRRSTLTTISCTWIIFSLGSSRIWPSFHWTWFLIWWFDWLLRLHLRLLVIECACTLKLYICCTWITIITPLFYDTQSLFTVQIFLISCCSTMNCVLPYIVELVIFSSNVIVQNWLPSDSFESASWVLSVIFILAWWAHLNHVKNVLCVWVLLLLQIQHFELLPHWRLMALSCNVSERSQWFLFTTIHLRICFRWIFFSDLLFSLSIEFYSRCFLWKTGQFWSNAEWKLSEWNFAIRVVT